MNLEDLVPLKETCQRLKDLGWKDETYLEWVPRVGRSSVVRPCNKNNVTDSLAPTASELVEVLPLKIKDTRFYTYRYADLWCADYENADYIFSNEAGHVNLAESIALLIIWLAENKHLEL